MPSDVFNQTPRWDRSFDTARFSSLSIDHLNKKAERVKMKKWKTSQLTQGNGNDDADEMQMTGQGNWILVMHSTREVFTVGIPASRGIRASREPTVSIAI
jgi:hypothetical protein